MHRELRAVAGLLPLAFVQLNVEPQQEVLCSDACPSGWAAHSCSWPHQNALQRYFAWTERSLFSLDEWRARFRAMTERYDGHVLRNGPEGAQLQRTTVQHAWASHLDAM